MNKRILYVDMDGVVANFEKGIKKFVPDLEVSDKFPNVEERSSMIDKVMADNPRMFLDLEPIEGAVEHVTKLFNDFDVFFLSTPVWHVPESFMDKRIWLHNYFGDIVKKKLILSHRKDLNIGHYLVDDRLHNGVSEFKGHHVHFGTEKFPDWEKTSKYLLMHNKIYRY